MKIKQVIIEGVMKFSVSKNKIIIPKPCDFNPAQTLSCGQMFRYKINGNACEVCSGANYAKIIETENKITIETKNTDYFISFFDFARDYSKIQKELKTDPIIKKALPYGNGIKIAKGDIIEVLFSFVISANNNIPRIQKIIEKLCAYGKDYKTYRAFPTLEILSKLPLEAYSSLGAGYRDKYLFKLSRELIGVNLKEKEKLETKELKKWLISLPGVGPKVADCVLLFGFNRFDVFPTDTWVEKLYKTYYYCGEKTRPQIAEFFVGKFKNNAGIAQQYLFNFMRNFDNKKAD